MKNYGYVYHTYCTISRKHYIGQHVGSKFDALYLGSGRILKRAILKYGEDVFEVTPIKWVKSREELNTAEIEFIAKFRKQYGARMVYNVSDGGGAFWSGKHHSNRTRKIISIAAKNMWKDPEKRKKLIENHTGLKRKPETGRRISRALKGRSLSIETRRKLRDANIGKRHTEETRAKMRASNKSGTPEMRIRLSDSMKPIAAQRSREHYLKVWESRRRNILLTEFSCV